MIRSEASIKALGGSCIFNNTSTASGTGKTVALQWENATQTNYQNTSDNNLFYAGTPGANNLIFYDGTNADQTIGTYKTRVAARDAASYTELPPFLSTAGASTNFLHLDPAIATLAESGAVNIAGYTDEAFLNMSKILIKKLGI